MNVENKPDCVEQSEPVAEEAVAHSPDRKTRQCPQCGGRKVGAPTDVKVEIAGVDGCEEIKDIVSPKPFPATSHLVGSFIPELPENGVGLVLSIAVLANPAQARLFKPSQPHILYDVQGRPVAKMEASTYLAETSEDIVAMLSQQLTTAFTMMEEQQEAHDAREAELELTEDLLMREGLQDVCQLDDGKKLVDQLGAYSVSMLVDAMINRLGKGLPLFVPKEGVLTFQDDILSKDDTDERSLYRRADLLASQIAVQPAPIAQKILGVMHKTWTSMCTLVTYRLSNPAEFGVSTAEGDPRFFVTPDGWTAAAMQAKPVAAEGAQQGPPVDVTEAAPAETCSPTPAKVEVPASLPKPVAEAPATDQQS